MTNTDIILEKVRTGELNPADAAELIAAFSKQENTAQTSTPQPVEPVPTAEPAQTPIYEPASVATPVVETVSNEHVHPPVAQPVEPVATAPVEQYQPPVTEVAAPAQPVQMPTESAPAAPAQHVPSAEMNTGNMPGGMPQPTYVPSTAPVPEYHPDNTSVPDNLSATTQMNIPQEKFDPASPEPKHERLHEDNVPEIPFGEVQLPPLPDDDSNFFRPVSDEVAESPSMEEKVQEKKTPGKHAQKGDGRECAQHSAKKQPQKQTKPAKPSRDERKQAKADAKARAKQAKDTEKAARNRARAAKRRGGPENLTTMERIAIKVGRLQKVTATLVAVAVLSGGVAVVSQIDANTRISNAFSGTTEIVTTTKAIKAGQEITADDLAIASVPTSLVSDGAITGSEAEDKTNTPVGQVATQYIPKGAQLTSTCYAGKKNQSSLATAIEDGKEAVTISVDAQSGMGGMLNINDKVKVLQPNDGSMGGDNYTVIAPAARVAALDGNFSSGTSVDSYSTVTLEVSPEQAAAIRTAGSITLTLPSAADTASAEKGE